MAGHVDTLASLCGCPATYEAFRESVLLPSGVMYLRHLNAKVFLHSAQECKPTAGCIIYNIYISIKCQLALIVL